MKVIIATDGSEFSRAAVAKFCQSVINPENLEIRIVSVYEKLAPMAAEPFAVSAEYYREVETAARKRAEVFTSDAAEQIRKFFPDANLEIDTQTIMGAPGKTIVEMAQEWNADLIVVGSHGYGFWSRTFLGSVSDSVVNHAPCSVLVVRQPENSNGNKS